MKRILLLAILLSASLSAQDYTWKAAKMDASRTGCTTPMTDNIKESIGEFDGKTFVAPNGRRFSKKSATAKTARHILDAQPTMAKVKEVVGYAPEIMGKGFPEGKLSNWAVDIIMSKVQDLSGKPVHMGVLNFGGIRADIPQGDVTLDDMKSIFPFKNHVVYLEMKGSEVRRLLEDMAAGRFQVLGGVKVVAENRQLVSAEVAGAPIDDDKVYGVATISFLLKGGDGLALEDISMSVQHFEEVDIIDAIMDFVRAEKAAGRPLTKELDGRVIVRR
jgi:2',3'-cyclic-nucleotide 2'-phosphodiesterase (5'-nucleotidase family)